MKIPYIRITTGPSAPPTYAKVHIDYIFCYTCWTKEDHNFWNKEVRVSKEYYNFKFLPLELLL